MTFINYDNAINAKFILSESVNVSFWINFVPLH